MEFPPKGKLDPNREPPYNYSMEDMIKDKEGKEIRIGSIVKMKGEDIEDGIVCGFDDGRIDVIELGDGFTIDADNVEVVSELNG